MINFIKTTAGYVGKIFTTPAKAVGKGALEVGQVAADAGAGKMALNNLNTTADFAYRSGKKTLDFLGDFFIRHDPKRTVQTRDKMGRLITKEVGGGFRMTKKGIATLAAVGVAGNAMSATDDYMQEKMGKVAPEKYTATPDYTPPSYAMNGGATGDLVFALNAQRSGGYL